MTRLLILGSGGMLGRPLMAEAGIDAIGLGRQVDVTDPTAIFMALYHTRPTVVINAAGIIPARNSDPTFAEMIHVNAIAPRLIAEECRKRDIYFIQVSSDCVTDCTDYGRSKALGEVVSPGCLTVRTSFMGPGHGLWEYIASRSQGGTVTGWDKARWSGSTVEAVAERLRMIARRPGTQGPGILTLATAEPITKYEACRLLIEHLGREDLTLVKGGPAIDRSMEPTMVLPSLADALASERKDP